MTGNPLERVKEWTNVGRARRPSPPRPARHNRSRWIPAASARSASWWRSASPCCWPAALVYTSFSASSEARTPSQLIDRRRARRGLQAHRQGRAGLRARAGPSRTSGCATAPARSRCPSPTTGTLPDPFREGREVIVNVRKQGDGFVGEKGSLITKCPSKFTAEQNDLTVLVAGKACLILALGDCLYGIAASLYGARPGRREWVASGRRAVYALAGTTARRVRDPRRRRSCARTSRSRSSRRTRRRRRRPSTARPRCGPRRRARCCCGCCSSASGRALILYLTRRRLREIAPYATAVLLGFGAFFAALLVFLETPFGQAVAGAGRGRRASTRCCGTRA